MSINLWVYFWTFNFAPLIHISLFMLVLNSFFQYSFVVNPPQVYGLFFKIKSNFTLKSYLPPLSFGGYHRLGFEVEICITYVSYICEEQENSALFGKSAWVVITFFEGECSVTALSTLLNLNRTNRLIPKRINRSYSRTVEME